MSRALGWDITVYDDIDHIYIYIFFFKKKNIYLYTHIFTTVLLTELPEMILMFLKIHGYVHAHMWFMIFCI